jgi:hypothetical protein
VTEFWEAKYKALRAAFIAWRHIERQDAKVQIKELQRHQSMLLMARNAKSAAERNEWMDKLWVALKDHIAERLG